MSTYSTAKEIWNDIKHDCAVIWLARILMGLIAIAGAVLIYKSATQPVKLWGVELNQEMIKHDTVYVTKRDTVKIVVAPAYNSKKPTVQKKFNVESHDQKGGQTAGEITNN